MTALEQIEQPWPRDLIFPRSCSHAYHPCVSTTYAIHCMLSTRASGEKRCDVTLQVAIKGWFEIGQDDIHQRIRVYRNKDSLCLIPMSDPKVGSASRYLVKSIDELKIWSAPCLPCVVGLL